MRIAHVITRLILGGAQENTLLCCEDLVRLYGDDVLLVTGPPLGPEGSLLERARAGGVPLESIPPLRRPIHPWRDWASYRQIKRVLDDFRPDVVHTHSAKGGILGRAAAAALGVPAIVHTVHGAPFHPYQSWAARAVFRACERWAAGKCHAFVSVADAMTDLMVDGRRGAAARSSPPSTAAWRSSLSWRPTGTASGCAASWATRREHVVVGKIARLFHLKGHEYVIRAARQVVDADAQRAFPAGRRRASRAASGSAADRGGRAGRHTSA